MRAHFLIHGETTLKATMLTESTVPTLVIGDRTLPYAYESLEQPILFKLLEIEAARMQSRDGTPKEEWAVIIFEGVDTLVHIKSKVWISVIPTDKTQANVVIGGERNDIIDVKPWERINLTKEDLGFLCISEDGPLKDLADVMFDTDTELSIKFFNAVPWDLPYVRALHDHPQLELLIDSWMSSMSLKDFMLIGSKVTNLPANVQIMHDLFAYIIRTGHHTELLKKLAVFKFNLLSHIDRNLGELDISKYSIRPTFNAN